MTSDDQSKVQHSTKVIFCVTKVINKTVHEYKSFKDCAQLLWLLYDLPTHIV